jgi:hyperosmotically inducible protein
MKIRIPVLCVCAALLMAPCLSPAQNNQPNNNNNSNNADQQYNPNTWSQPDAIRIVKEVRHRLLSLADYDVFDSLRFALKGRTVILEGYASRPVLKSEAEKVVKGIEGVEAVDNEIKVLPTSPMDDRIRIAVYRRIYGEPALRKYFSGPGSGPFLPSVALEAGGITQDPPLGYHAIHIIVDNGHVTLTGVVDSQSDADIATMQANSTPGVFSVDNDLQIAGQPKKNS